MIWRPFGSEYALRPAWGFWRRLFMKFFGLVDFPSRLRGRLITRKVDALRPKRVLDLGSGTGCYAFYFSRQPAVAVHGVDIDRKRIGDSIYIAKRLCRRNVSFTEARVPLDTREFPSSSFDVVLAVEMLQYLDDVQNALREINRLLRPGGHLVGHVPVLGSIRPHETMVFNDAVLKDLLLQAGFRPAVLTPTLGGALGRLCAVCDRLGSRLVLMGLLFPFFMLASALLRIESPDGRYRLLVARKPPNPTVS